MANSLKDRSAYGNVSIRGNAICEVDIALEKKKSVIHLFAPPLFNFKTNWN